MKNLKGIKSQGWLLLLGLCMVPWVRGIAKQNTQQNKIFPPVIQHLGTYGATFSIKEDNFMAVLMARLHKAQSEGRVKAVHQRLVERTQENLKHPAPVKRGGQRLPPTMYGRFFFFDPTIVMEKDIQDAHGKTIVRGGTRLNPLTMMSWGAPLVFLDGDDPQQVAWVKGFLKGAGHALAKVTLVKGSPLELEKTLNRPVYFDQRGQLTQRLGFTHVPCVVTQEGLRLRLEEKVPGETKGHEAKRRRKP